MYIVEFPLKTKSQHEAMIEKLFTHCCTVYNKANSILTKEWNRITEECKEDGKIDYKKRREIANTISYDKDGITSNAAKDGGKEYPMFSRYGIIYIVGSICKKDIGNGRSYSNLGDNNIWLNSLYQGEIALRLSSAWDKVKKDGKSAHWKRVNEWKSMKTHVVEGKSKHLLIDADKKTVSIKYGKDGTMVIPFVANPRKKEYEAQALSSNIKEIGIKKETVRGKTRYYLSITVEGVPYSKGRQLGEGAIGIDPGVSSVTYYGKTIGQYSIDLDIKALEAEKAKLQRYLDRSRREMNKNNFTQDGQVKRGIKLVWVKSKRYIKAQDKLREIERKIADKRKREQIRVANLMLSEGNELHVEKNDVSSWAKRKDGITKDKNGRIKSNKRFGKSISNAAPSQFLTIVKNKFTSLGGTIVEVDAVNAAATATDHTSNFTKTKRELKERSVMLSDGTVHDRDAHAAFNLKHCNENGEYNATGMNSDYENFCQEEKKAWNTLKYQK